MKIIFISSGNKKYGISPVVRSQAESLSSLELSIDFYTIRGRGFTGYIKAVFKLHNKLRKVKYNLIHAHYSLSGFVAALAGAKPLVVSLMGSDVKASGLFKRLIQIFNRFTWEKCIVKSEDMKNSLGINSVEVIPNGVDLNKFRPVSKEIVLTSLGWDNSKKHILFASDPLRFEKNFILLREAINIIENKTVMEVHNLSNVPHENVYNFMNAADVIVLTSLWEGSPNVIKEAMACNRPIVSTNVGDVAWIFGETEGCYLTGFDPIDVAMKLNMALEFSDKKRITKGRERIVKLGLDDKTIAKRIINVYKEVIG